MICEGVVIVFIMCFVSSELCYLISHLIPLNLSFLIFAVVLDAMLQLQLIGEVSFSRLILLDDRIPIPLPLKLRLVPILLFAYLTVLSMPTVRFDIIVFFIGSFPHYC